MKNMFKSIGPAIIVAAVVLGPGSILTSSKVGATFGILGLPVIVGATVLMIAMVALAARLGAVYERSLCDELAARLGRPVAVAIGLTLFVLVAFFQSSNNIAVIGGIEPLFGSEPLGFPARCSILVVANLLIIGVLYLLRDLYRSVESLMKLLMAMMTVAFLLNFIVIFSKSRTYEPVAPTGDLDWLPLLGMIGTTFSVGGAFYQAYLVKEKGWGPSEVRKAFADSVLSMTLLGGVTTMILLTSWRVFYGHPNPVGLSSVGDVARQLEPLFGSAAKIIFCLGILAGALSSFLVNALIGGTVMSDSIGKGANLRDKWPLHLTAIALLVGMSVAIASLAREGSTVHLIMIAQALTVLGIPALAAALIYLGTRKELQGERRVSRGIITLAVIGFCVACVLAVLTAVKVYGKLNPPSSAAQAASSQVLASWHEKPSHRHPE
jgi:manganese transport protein